MEEKKKSRLRKFLHKSLEILGIFFLLLGFIGIFIPVFPQIPFLIIGLLILGEESIYTGWVFKKLPPKVSKKLKKLLNTTKSLIKINGKK